MPGEEQIQQPAIFNSYTIEKKKGFCKCTFCKHNVWILTFFYRCDKLCKKSLGCFCSLKKKSSIIDK